MNLEKISAVRPGSYDLNWAELHELSAIARDSRVDAIVLAYKYGFLRGGNAEKANAKRKAVRA